MRYAVLFLSAVLFAGCQVPEEGSVSNLSTDEALEPIVETTPGTDCWADHVKTNGFENLPYPTQSQAAGNTFYACYGNDSEGSPHGWWLAFYENGTVYFGTGDVMPWAGLLDTSDCRFYWRDGATNYAYAESATLNANGELTSIRMADWDNASGGYKELIDYTCQVAN